MNKGQSARSRFGLVGDIHAEDTHLAAALDHFACEQVHGILAVGDIADGRGDVDRCVALLEQHRVTTVRGNHDRWLLHGDPPFDRNEWRAMNSFPGATVADDLTVRTRAWLRGLPPSCRVESAAGPMLLCHGFADDDMIFLDEVLVAATEKARRRVQGQLQRLIPDDIAIVVAGHTHRRGVRQIGRLTVVNPGTLRSGDNPCFAVLDLAARVVKCFDIDDHGRVLEAETLSTARR